MAGTFKGKHNEERIQGKNACLAVFARRRDDIVQVFVARDKMRTYRNVLQWAKEAGTLDRICPRADLDKIARAKHHEGIFFIAKKPRPWRIDRALVRAENQTVVILENVKDPHNLGAILRVCAHFDVGAVFCTGESATRSPAMFRTAQGAAEYLPMVYSDNESVLAALREERRTVFATLPLEASDIYSADLGAPNRSAFVFGAERDGISDFWKENANVSLAIPGTGHVESLNISCAVSALLGEVYRRSAA